MFTYNLKDGLETLKDKRQAAEKDKVKAGEPVYYPTWDDLRAEDREVEPELILTVRDQAGNVVRRLKGDGGSRAAPHDLGPALPEHRSRSVWATADRARPGTATTTDRWRLRAPTPSVLSQRVRGVESQLAEPVTFTTALLGVHSTPATDCRPRRLPEGSGRAVPCGAGRRQRAHATPSTSSATSAKR